MSTNELHTFQGMPGVRRPIRGPLVRTPNAMLSALKDNRLASAAGDYGAVTAYYDDKRQLRACFQRRFQTIADGVFPSKAALRRWLVEWMPKMRDPS